MKPPDDCAGIDDVREAIDELDREILRLLAERGRYVAAAARFKTDQQSVQAPERQKTMLSPNAANGQEEGLDQDFVESLYQNIVSYFIEREMDRWQERRGPNETS